MSPSPFVHIVDEVPELVLDEGTPGPVLLVSLDGFLDAGGAAQSALAHLTGDAPGRVVATFDVDAFYDYRARRPPMTFSEDHYEDYQAPRLVCRLMHDAAGTAYLLLHGPEPDTHWEAFCVGVRNALSGAGALVGLWLVARGDETVGTAVVVTALAYMLLSSLAMGVADLLGIWRPRGGSVRGTIASSVLPAVALVAIAV